MTPPFDPTRDLLLERVVPVPAALVWRALTEPALLLQWFCPRPWSVSACTLDLQPGGRFSFTMRSPEGQEFPSEGCVLAVDPGVRLVWTDALHAGYRPAARGIPTDGNGGHEVTFSAHMLLEPLGPSQTRYRAYAIHPSPEAREKHEQMGFHHGWGAALDQLVELMSR